METVGSIVANVGILAVIALIASVTLRRSGVPPDSPARRVVIGIVLGASAALVILAPIAGPMGSSFDSRAAPLVLAGVFGGWPAALIVAACGSLARWQVGGPTALAGIVAVVFYAAAGLAFTLWRRKRPHTPWRFLQLGLLSFAVAMPAFFLFLPVETALAILSERGVMLFASNVGGVLLLGLFMAELFALETANDSLRRQTKALDIRVATAELASDAKSRFLATMSHELRTPLNAVIGLADVLRTLTPDRLGPQRTDANLAAIHANGVHLLSLVNDILDLARIERDGDFLTSASVDGRALADRAVAMVSPTAAARGVRIVIDAPDCAMACDERAALQCLVNLLSNAVRYAPDASCVRVVVTEAAALVTISVHDAGPGMPPDLIHRIGEPFLKSEFGQPGRAASSGAGLGLAITKALLGRQGGTLAFATPEGGGTVASMTLPSAAANMAAA